MGSCASIYTVVVSLISTYKMKGDPCCMIRAEVSVRKTF